MSLNEITPLLSKLSAEELDRLGMRVKAMRSLIGSNITNTPATVVEDNTDLALLLKCASETAMSLGADNSAYFQLRKAAHQSLVFQEKMPEVMSWIRKGCQTRTQQHALLCLAMRLLYKDMTEGGYPVSARTILAHVHRIPSVVNKHFPGYFRAGLLHWIVERRKSR